MKRTPMPAPEVTHTVDDLLNDLHVCVDVYEGHLPVKVIKETVVQFLAEIHEAGYFGEST